MGLNISKGNMYEWVTHTWNTVKGKCFFDCSYCYMKKRDNQKPVRLDKSELNTDLGKDNFIFVGSSCDMFNYDVPDEWIFKTFEHMSKYDNSYLIQSKNPGRIKEFLPIDAHKYTICTTIETNRYDPNISKAPSPLQRAKDMNYYVEIGIDTIVTIEPIMKFDIDRLLELIMHCGPMQVNIGANSRSDIVLPEPSKEEILELIDVLERHTKVKIKDNLKRLMK